MMMATQVGVHTYSEILSQPRVWGDAAAAFATQSAAIRALLAHAGDRLMFTGCGSTHYLSRAGAALYQWLTGAPAAAHPASEIALLPESLFTRGSTPLLVASSRSGETTETVEAVRSFRRRSPGRVIAVTCDSASSLAKAADLSLAIDAAQEVSLAQTRSFSCMAIMLQGMAALAAGRDDLASLEQLGALIGRRLDDHHGLMRALGEDRQIERFFFLGMGAHYGIACEAMLKMKEMSLSYSEAYHTLEFRHGPMSMVNDKTLIVGILTDETAAVECAVLREMHGRGARILALAEHQPDLPPSDRTHIVTFASGLPAWARVIVPLPFLQLMGYYRALTNGENPDLPANLTAVIALNESLM